MELTSWLLILFTTISSSRAIFFNSSYWWIPKTDATSVSASMEPSVKFYLYTRSNPTTPQLIEPNDINALAVSHFNSTNPTRFIAHGWQNDLDSQVNVLLRDALLANDSCNVLCVDWSESAQLNYKEARNNVAAAGRSLAQFIDFLHSAGGLSLGSLQLIGHSLGAHICGYAGKLVASGRVHHIVGLDPALPLFSYAACATRLCNTDASFVETIHTNGGVLGFLQPIGTLAFYPNGGETQPACSKETSVKCSHERSFIYYAEAIRGKIFPAFWCASYEHAAGKNCYFSYSWIRMGSFSNYGVSGCYFVRIPGDFPLSGVAVTEEAGLQ